MSRKGLVMSLAAVSSVLVLTLGCQQAAAPQPTPKAAAAAPTKASEKGAVAATKPVERPVRGGTLRIGLTADANTLDPNVTTAYQPIWTATDALTGRDKDRNINKEGLFKDWNISADGKGIVFKLQVGVKFHDGTDFDAEAVKFNIDRMKDPATKSPYRSDYATVDSVEVVDNTTVRFKLNQIDPLLIPKMGQQGGRMVSPTAVKKYGQDFGRHPVGTGAFQFVEWVPSDHISFKRFDGYWGKDKDGNQLPYLDRVTYKILPDETVAVANLRTAQIDLLRSVSIEQWPSVKNDPNLAYSVGRSDTIGTGIYLNTKRPPFDNKALRQAVALAVDRDGLAARWGEGAILQASVLHPTNWGYDGKAGLYPARDLTKAKAKMAEAGYPTGGLKVTMETWNSSGLKWVPEISKANLAEIGIEEEIEVLAREAFFAKVREEGTYQLAMGNTGFGMSDPGYIFGLMFHSQGGRNYFGPYSNPQVDQFLDKAGSIYDQKERTTLYQQAANLISDDVPFIPLLVGNTLVGMNKKVRNYIQYPDSDPLEAIWLAPQ